MSRRVLFLACHCDDELTSAATLRKFIEQGHKIIYVALSVCGIETLHKECEQATKTIGIHSTVIYNYPNRTFAHQRQEILDRLLSIRKEAHPDLVFCPSSFDTHQDHQTLHHEAKRAFKGIQMLGYEFPWNYTHSNLTCPSPITEAHLNVKLEALSKYTSQANKPYFNPDFIRGLAKVRGVQFQTEYAEAFEVIRTEI